MNDAPRRTLRELIARHGTGLCSDARRCEGLLRDLCGGHRREVNILVGALRERVPLDLLAGRNSVPTGLLLTRLAKRLEEHLALTEEASRWAVDSWALALGIVSDADLDGIESRRREAAAPRVEAAPPPAAQRPAVEGEARAGGPAADAVGRPPATPPRARQSPQPPAPQPRITANRASPPPTASPASRTPAQGGPSLAARRYPSPPPAPRTPSAPPAANTGGHQAPAADAAPRGRAGRWRGCLVGCFLVALLAVLLAVGVPYVVNLLREEQQQRSLEPAPGQTR